MIKGRDIVYNIHVSRIRRPWNGYPDEQSEQFELSYERGIT